MWPIRKAKYKKCIILRNYKELGNTLAVLVVRSPLLPRDDEDRETGWWEGDKPGEELPDLAN